MFLPVNKVVVSYSRKDSVNVKKLVADFKRLNIDLFLDVEDIPPGVNWERCLEHAIANAYAVIFALSESSIKSEVCQWEIAIAHKNNVAILPIVFDSDSVELETLPEPICFLQKTNWIFLSNELNYESELQKIFDILLQIDIYKGELNRSPKAKITTFCQLKSGQNVTDYYVLASKCYTFGRNPEATNQASLLKTSGDLTVSSRHAIFLWQPQHQTYAIRDGNLDGDAPSRFGVYVGCRLDGGKAIQGRRLEEGEFYALKNLEFVRFGQSSFFCYEAVQGSTIEFDGKDTLANE